MRTALRLTMTAVEPLVVLALAVVLAACGSGSGLSGSQSHPNQAGPASTSGTGMGPGMMSQSGAPRMMGRGQGVPPPTVTFAPTATPGGYAPVSFSNDIRPILRSQCSSCHGGQGGLWLFSYEQVMFGGQSGKVVVPGNPDQSLLYLYVTGEKQPQMPLNVTPLNKSEIAAIREWIAEGAPKN